MHTRFWAVLVILAVIVIAAAVWLGASLWMFKVVAAGQTGSHVQIVGSNLRQPAQPLAAWASRLLVPQDVQPALAAFSRWVYTEGPDHQSLVGMTRQLSRLPDGWHERRLGPYTILSFPDPAVFNQKIAADIARLAYQILLDRVQPVQPGMIIELPGHPGPLWLSGKTTGSVFAFAYSQIGPITYSLPHSGGASVPESLYIALPSSALSYVPTEVQATIHNNIIAELGFNKTRPDIISLFEAGEAVAVAGVRAATASLPSPAQPAENSDGTAAIAILGGGGALDQAVREWVAAERGYLSPVRHAFRLPDGTIGYEYIPSPDAGDGFSEPGADGCAASAVGNRQVWLCRSGEVVAVGNTADDTRSLMETLSASAPAGFWRVELPAAYAAQVAPALGLSETRLIGVTAAGSDNTAAGFLFFS